MKPDTIVRVTNSGPSGIRSVWFKDVPEGITNFQLQAKMLDIFAVSYEDWEFDWMSELPHKTIATHVYNWVNC